MILKRVGGWVWERWGTPLLLTPEFSKTLPYANLALFFHFKKLLNIFNVFIPPKYKTLQINPFMQALEYLRFYYFEQGK